MRRKVAIYARVSTEHEAQISALENQVQYYDELLKWHPEWDLVERYIDEGITGTSINKRQGFLRMMSDAATGKFDLIITREVSRFARNTVDTLQQTRKLKAMGVEVWFTEDNIWTMNDEDGELRLSIMATLAQNESKKISQRVKAGQLISFKNGVLYGNGNILGYDRVGSQMVINEEQADTVKRIFELYLSGCGVRKIQDVMEQEGRKTASGLTKWQAGNINRVLQNPFYCGRIEYRKQFVPDYLTQKKINNHGEVEKIYVEGDHERIISEEDFDEAIRLRESRRVYKKDAKGNLVPSGQSPYSHVYGSKVKCTCGHAMNRRLAHVSKSGEPSFCYQCYAQLRTGTPGHRLRKGLSIEGVCDNSMFMQWKLDVAADFIFKKLLRNREAIYKEAIAMIGELDSASSPVAAQTEAMEDNRRYISKLKSQLNTYMDMCADGDISRETFREKKQAIENQIAELEQNNSISKQQIQKNENEEEKKHRIESLQEFVNMKAFDPRAKIPESLIEAFVDKIVFDKGVFSWYLNPKFGNEVFDMDTADWEKSMLNRKKKRTMPYQLRKTTTAQ
ncbi:Site-specific DNA recombinase [Lachnospiraceae bacterium C10]|nr:Site-specific DNA recombinase [Lachnospiraceae bacterium C10]